MGPFKKKIDPISDRARTLNAEIAALEAKIKKLNDRAKQPAAPPKLRPAPPPHSVSPNPTPAPAAISPKIAKPSGTIFESVNHDRLKAPGEKAKPVGQSNKLDVRKYDLVAAFQRMRNQFRGRSAANPKLVSYLAAGSIQGLRPLRYEKRVARNRFIFVTIVFLLVVWGIIAVFGRRH